MMAMLEDMKKLSYTRFRKACRKVGLGKVKKRRTSKARIARERHAEEGYMWQLDGSPEVWFGDEVNCLVALIDDATSKIPNAELHPTETTWACMKVVMKAILKYGRPEFILTDKAGWSEGSGRKRRHFSQFERACRELDITVIATPSAESKGRVERLNRTFQDRLIPELDLFKIKKLIDSNRYIDQVFIPALNEKFSVEASKITTRYRPVEKHLDLAEIFCLKHDRAVNRDHTVSYNNERYKIFPEPGKTYKGKQIKVHEYEDKTISLFYGSKKLDIQKIAKLKRVWEKSA
jgi:transposase-like protein